jgi:Uncharacterised nucleotidyltransferase
MGNLVDVCDLPVTDLEYAPYEALGFLFGSKGKLDSVNAALNGYAMEEVFRSFLHCGMPHVLGAVVSSDASPKETNSCLESYRQVSEICLQIQLECWSELNRALRYAGVDAVIPKGRHLVEALAPGKLAGFSDDIDILVHPDQIARTKAVLNELGYVQQVGIRDRKIVTYDQEDIEQFEMRGFELAPFLRVARVPALEPYGRFVNRYDAVIPPILQFEDSWSFGVQIDVHQTLDPYVDVDDMWRDLQEVMLADTPTLVPSLATVGWFIPSRFYYDVIFHGETGAKPIADLAAIVSTRGMDYDGLLHVAQKYNGFLGSVFYVYRFLRQLGLVVPDEAAFMAAPTGRRSTQIANNQFPAADLGDFLPRIFGRRVAFRLDTR